jgi:protein-S-isoprenylcysteine O-methyltransferase Ste14
MMDILGKIAWLLLAGSWYGLRIPYQRKARRARIARDELQLPERIRLAVSLTGLGIIPFVYVASSLAADAGLTHHRLLGFADHTRPGWIIMLGILLIPAALLMFRLTHKALGRNWSVSLQLKDEHKLITEGVYARIRHPMYSAFWLWALAQALILPNWVAGFAGILGFGTLYLLRVGPEEQMMLDGFGDDYRAYMGRTGRLWPKF